MESSVGSEAYNLIDWQSGQMDWTIRDGEGNVKRIKQLDGSICLWKRKSPTIVFETGYTQRYSQLRLIAQTYLLGGTTNGVPAIDTSGNEIPRIQLVVLIAFTGKRPDPADKSIGSQDYDEDDYIDSTKTTLKPLSVRIDPAIAYGRCGYE